VKCSLPYGDILNEKGELMAAEDIETILQDESSCQALPQ